MIRVTIEMVPGGVGKPYIMHVIEIFNEVGTTLTSGGTHGDYGYRISRKLSPNFRQAPTVTLNAGWAKLGSIKNFNRKNRNAVQLLVEVLRDAYPKGPNK